MNAQGCEGVNDGGFGAAQLPHQILKRRIEPAGLVADEVRHEVEDFEGDMPERAIAPPWLSSMDIITPRGQHDLAHVLAGCRMPEHAFAASGKLGVAAHRLACALRRPPSAADCVIGGDGAKRKHLAYGFKHGGIVLSVVGTVRAWAIHRQSSPVARNLLRKPVRLWEDDLATDFLRVLSRYRGPPLAGFRMSGLPPSLVNGSPERQTPSISAYGAGLVTFVQRSSPLLSPRSAAKAIE